MGIALCQSSNCQTAFAQVHLACHMHSGPERPYTFLFLSDLFPLALDSSHVHTLKYLVGVNQLRYKRMYRLSHANEQLDAKRFLTGGTLNP